MRAERNKYAVAFGKLLREQRRVAGLTQEVIAFEAGLDRVFISMLERGVRQPTLTTIAALADAMEADAGEMVRLTIEAAN